MDIGFKVNASLYLVVLGISLSTAKWSNYHKQHVFTELLTDSWNNHYYSQQQALLDSQFPQRPYSLCDTYTECILYSPIVCKLPFVILQGGRYMGPSGTHIYFFFVIWFFNSSSSSSSSYFRQGAHLARLLLVSWG